MGNKFCRFFAWDWRIVLTMWIMIALVNIGFHLCKHSGWRKVTISSMRVHANIAGRTLYSENLNEHRGNGVHLYDVSSEGGENASSVFSRNNGGRR